MDKIDFAKLQDRTLIVEHVIGEIKRAILRGKLSFGQKLPSEIKLAEMFNVSRAPIKEALTALRFAGIIEIKQGGGMRIREKIVLSSMVPLFFYYLLNKGTQQETLELREIIEIGALEIVIHKVKEEDLVRMQETIEKLQHDTRKGIIDKENLGKYDLEFHYAFARSTHNWLIIELTKAFWEAFSFSIRQTIQTRKHAQGTIENHTAILESIRKRDFNRARTDIKKALRDWAIHGFVRGKAMQKTLAKKTSPDIRR